MMEKTVKKAEFTYILLPRIHLYVCVAVCGKAALVELVVAFEISHSALHKTLYFEHFSLSLFTFPSRQMLKIVALEAKF